MNIYDSEAVQKVWDRVCQQENEPEPAGQMSALDPEQLRQMIAHEREDSCTYFAMAAAACGETATHLRRIGQEEACHAKQLQAVYYVLSGQCLCKPCCKQSQLDCLNEMLRLRVTEEQKGAQIYLEAADHAGAYAPLFRRLAMDEQRHADTLLQMLQCRMG